MNKIIVSSTNFLARIRVIETTNYGSWEMVASKEGLSIGSFKFECHCQNDFKVTIYRRSLTKLIKILRQIEEQPITLQFEDSELFNIKICEMTI